MNPTVPKIDKELVSRHFSDNAHHYDEVTPIQNEMALTLTSLLANHIPTPRINTIVELGCGTGRLTEILMRNFPAAKITAIDISPEMIEQAKKKLNGSSNIELVQADAETLSSQASSATKPDLIISNATAQWFHAPVTTLGQWQRKLSDNGIICFSTFGPQTFNELRSSFRKAETALELSHQQRTLEFPDMQEWKNELEHTGLAGTLDVSEEIKTVYYDSVRKFLKTVKSAGASSAFRRDSAGLSKRLYSLMTDEYNENFRCDTTKRIKATYHIYYILCKK